MAFLFFHQRPYFDQIMINTMQTDTIEKYDIRSLSSYLDNLISSLPIGNCNSSITVLRSINTCVATSVQASVNQRSSASSTKAGSVVPISALPLPLSCTKNTVSIPITKNGESVFDKNNRLRVKICLLPLTQLVTIVQFDADFFSGSYSIQSAIVATVNIY